MDTATRVQILDNADCISHSTNILAKGLGSLALVKQPVKEKEKSELKPVKLRSKIYLVSYPLRAHSSCQNGLPL